MKKTCLYLFILAIFFSCKKESDEPAISESHITSISGKIDNWTLGADYKIKICQFTMPSNVYTVLDSSGIDSNGNFNITLNSVPATGAMDFGDSVQISDNSAKISTGFLWLKVFSKNNQIVGSVNYGKFTDINSGRYAGDVGIGYYYVDKDVKIVNSKKNTIINLSFSKGWNKLVQKYVTTSKTEFSIDFSETNLKDAHWIFH